MEVGGGTWPPFRYPGPQSLETGQSVSVKTRASSRIEVRVTIQVLALCCKFSRGDCERARRAHSLRRDFKGLWAA